MIAGGARARRTDPDTSREAADMVRDSNSANLRTAILKTLEGNRELSDEQMLGIGTNGLYAVWGVRCSPSGFRSRRSELVAMGYVRHAGYGQTRAGRACRKWHITQEGQVALDKLKDGF